MTGGDDGAQRRPSATQGEREESFVGLRNPAEPHPSPLRVDTFPWQGKEDSTFPAFIGVADR